MNKQYIQKVDYITSLIVADMKDELTPEKKQALQAWLAEDGENYLLYESLMDEDQLGNDLNDMMSYDPQKAFENLSQKIAFTEATTTDDHADQPKGKRLYFRIWYTAAAIILVIAGGIAYFSINKKQPAAIPQAAVLAQKKAADSLADTKKAVLILGDGSTITLSDMNNGDIARQGNVLVYKNENGQLEYKLTGANAGTNSTNIIRTPRGGEYQVILDDGTKIWLNSASTLQFPVHFNSEDRRVALTGEAYFEVESAVHPQTGKKKSFIVTVDNMEVQAVGTSFNISAYQEDKRSQTTVVEGLVRVSKNNRFSMLKPGKKLVTADSTMTIEDADIKQETAWKNGDFVFRNTSLKMVMNELGRWYDMDVVYDKNVPSLHFSGEVERKSTIKAVLQMLEYTGGVNFTIKNGTITVHAGK